MTLKKAQSHRGNKEKTEKRHKINKIKYMMILSASAPSVMYSVVVTVVVFFLRLSLMTPSCLSVLSVWPSNIALQCPQIQIHHYHVGLWAGHHLGPQLPAPSSGAQVSH